MADLRSLVLQRNNHEAAARFLAQAEQGDVDAVLAQLLAVTGYPSLLRPAMRMAAAEPYICGSCDGYREAVSLYCLPSI